MTNLKIINLLCSAVDLAGDGGPAPFTDKEYDAMYNFLEKLKKQNNKNK